jgi:restriction endonuclease S subunit
MPDYLRWYLSVPLVTDKILLKEGWQMQRAIKISTLSDIYIPIPPLQKQKLIVQICATGIKREKLYSELIEQEKLYMNAQIQKIIGGTAE